MPPHIRPRRLLAVVAVAAVGLFAGCSKVKTATVKGVVQYQNEPVKGALVKFHGADRVASAMTQADGSYTCEDAPWGPVKVTVEVIAAGLPGEKMKMGGPGGGMPGGAMPGGAMPGGPAGAPKTPVTGSTTPAEKIPKAPDGSPPLPEATAKIPAKYKNAESSGLNLDIDAKEKTFDIKLQ